MPDREKVIQAMEWCQENACEGCPYDTHNNESCGISDDILALLKEQEEQIDTQRKNLMILLNEQEAVEPKHNPLSPTDWFCGKCGMCISRFHDYCPSCGQAVKWDA